jgi:hypothetical protein
VHNNKTNNKIPTVLLQIICTAWMNPTTKWAANEKKSPRAMEKV